MLQWYSCYMSSLLANQSASAPIKMNISLGLLQCLGSPLYEGDTTYNTYMLPDRLIYDMMEWVARVEFCHPDAIQRSIFRDEYARRFRLCDTVYETDFDESLQKASDLGICLNRLWNLISVCPRTWRDLPALMAMTYGHDEKDPGSFRQLEDFSLRASPASRSTPELIDQQTHDACTSDLCHFSSMDSTRVAQRHKCADLQSCYFLHFTSNPNESLGRMLWNSRSTSSEGQIYSPMQVDSDYVAISHVWSDGTGAGTEGRGMVNSCLFDFFCTIARQLGCHGIWWDAISIPLEPKARAQALRTMHSHFSSAKHTVVHDEYLIHFPWKEDGTPCLALLLSPWFTRGWTAVELAVSHSVKVLFKDPTGATMPLIKDLENDVLANTPTCSLGHLIASSIIRKLRTITTRNRSLAGLMAILKTRSNSWPRDRAVIAALLAGIKPDIDAVNMQARVTQQIISSYSTVRGSFLIHGSPTISTHGPLSWCPSNLFNEGPTILSKEFQAWNTLNLTVDQTTGALLGNFIVFNLFAVKDNSEPFSMHSAVLKRLNSAYMQPSDYFVLRCSLRQRYSLVVRPKAITESPMRAIECDWVGVIVSDVSTLKVDLETSGDYEADVSIRIGTQSRVAEEISNAREFLDRYRGRYDEQNAKRGMYSELDFDPTLKGYLWNVKTGKWEKAGHGSEQVSVSP
ncbi:hypothetical protein, variant [Phialophora macrospora]|nr:hypothetical protein, variant [Phialophora macrospora]